MQTFALCILLVLLSPVAAKAAIFACPSGDTVVYQDWPCPIPRSVEVTTKQPQHHFPLSIHESWFDLPEQAEERAFCDRRGCECGRVEQKHQESLMQSVADALYLDGSWHRYETSYRAWLEAPTSSRESHQQREHMLEASCRIMMAQVLLRHYADDVITSLKKRVRTAEERGFDIRLPCEQGIPEACEYFASVQLYEQLLMDAAALRRPRTDDFATTLTDSEASADL